jgi:hypothetical protein
MSGWLRLGVVLSIVWMIVVLFFASMESDSTLTSVTFGAFPLVILWGIWWIAQGFRRRTSNAQSATSPTPRSEQAAGELEVVPQPAATPKSRWWLVPTMILLVFAVIGQTAAIYIPAAIGTDPDGVSLFGTLLWYALLAGTISVAYRKRFWPIAAVGAVVGFVVFVGAATVSS